jgi:hypothetical protein
MAVTLLVTTDTVDSQRVAQIVLDVAVDVLDMLDMLDMSEDSKGTFSS